MPFRNSKKKIVNIIGHVFFWGFNLPLCFTILNFLIPIIWQLLKEANSQSFRQFFDFMPIDIVVTLIIFFSMPIIAVIGVLLTRSYRKPTKLLQILYGIELPIMAFTFGRMIFLKSLTPVNIVLLSTAAISIVGYLLYISKKHTANKFLAILHLFACQAAVVIGLYASFLMFFFLPIVIAGVIGTISSFFRYGVFSELQFYENFWSLFTSVIAFGAFGTLFISLISTPFLGLLLYSKAAARLGKIFPKKLRWGFSLGYMLILVAIGFQGSLLLFNKQIESYQANNSFEERSHIAQEILKREDFLKSKLVETYLAHYRYLTDAQMTVLQQAYQDQTKFTESTAVRLQNWFTLAAFPFVYNGNFDEDVKGAGKNYETIFDEPIQLAETKRVNQILASSFNFSMDELKSSVLDRDDNDVLLVKRSVSSELDPTAQFATVTIEEEYENLANIEQEVFYIFSLPQDSVITDLQLGADLELSAEKAVAATPSTPAPTSASTPTPIEKKDQGEIAAKGAANETFEDQYNRRIDPAILEQVGPKQYKLRVYPIPVKEENLNGWQRGRLTEPVRNQKVRFSYVTAVASDGRVALPKITESRNVFSNSKTVADTAQSLQVKTTASPDCGTQAGELLTDSKVTLYIPHSINPWLSDAQIPFDCQNQFAGAELVVKNKKIAILADSSYSMGVHDWKKYLSSQLPLDQLLDTNTVDLYYFNELTSQPINLNQQRNNPKAWDQIAFGKTDRLQALKQVAGSYDLVLLFTDGSEADEPGTKGFTPSIAQPMYLITAGGKIPKLPDNLTYYLQVNEARVVATGTEALQNFAVHQAVKQNFADAFVLVGESGTWVSLSLSNLTELPQVTARLLNPGEPLAKLAMHRQIEAEMRDAAKDLTQLSVLDNLNRMAQMSGIVTPFSSLIVLTTPEQKEQLKQALLNDSRYLVNYDLGEEALAEPTAGGLLGTSAVPEPHEWALLLCGLLLLSLLARKKIAVLLAQHHA